MKKLTYVILLLSITALCFGHNNESKLFGLAKTEISSETAGVLSMAPGDQLGSVTVSGTNVLGYMELTEGIFNNWIYAETEGYDSDLLEVYIFCNQGCVGYNSRSDGGHLIYIEVGTTHGLGLHWGSHRNTINGTTYQCQTFL